MFGPCHVAPELLLGGIVYHALNRAAARLPLFHKRQDYEAFERVMAEAMVARPTRLLAYCLMPNHWHLVLWPKEDGELSAFVGWLSHTHAMRYRTHYHDGGVGHLYQQRYKSFPVQEETHFLKGGPVRGAQRPEGQPGGARPGLAVGQPLAADPHP